MRKQRTERMERRRWNRGGDDEETDDGAAVANERQRESGTA